MTSIHELLKQVYPLSLRMELFNKIWTNWREDIKEKDQRIIELEEQLKNAIIPKFKQGQEVWTIRGKENKRIDKCKVYGFVNNQCIRLKTSNKGHITRDLINTFTTKEEAQAKLKELKGE